jgi:hypothetical protein
MQLLAAVALGVLFIAGALVGLGLAIVFVPVALICCGRPVHRNGVVVRAELIARDAVLGPGLAGPAWVRLSGAGGSKSSAHMGSDVLGLALRMRHPGAKVSDDPTVGDQDVLFGTFESFRTAVRDRKATNAADYLRNRYSSVTPWWVRGVGPSTLRLIPDSSMAPGPAASVSDRRVAPVAASIASGDDAIDAIDAIDAATGEPKNRLQRLDEALHSDRARLILILESGESSTEIAELHLTERTEISGHRLRASMFRAGRGIRAVGFRNGIRATLYPLSQLARRIRER